MSIFPSEILKMIKENIRIAIAKSPKGTQISLAKELSKRGCRTSQSRISHWLRDGAVPIGPAILIEEMYDGFPSRYDLCPSLAKAKKKKA